MEIAIPGMLGNCHFSNIECVLMDLDGTLINTLDLHIESFQWILKKLGKDVSKEDLGKLMGRTPHDIIMTFFEDIPPEQVWKAAHAKENYLETIIQDVHVYPGVFDFLVKLKKHQVKTVVISSTYGELVEKLLIKADLLRFFDHIVSGDEIKRGKPDPEPFLLGLKKADASIGTTIGIGDSIFDGLACRNGGLQFIGVLTGKTSLDRFSKEGSSA